jgi:hypothetical protein
MKNKPEHMNQVSSPGKVYHSRASKPSSVAAMPASANLVGVDGTGSNAAPLVETESRLDALEAKMNALVAALKK